MEECVGEPPRLSDGRVRRRCRSAVWNCFLGRKMGGSVGRAGSRHSSPSSKRSRRGYGASYMGAEADGPRRLFSFPGPYGSRGFPEEIELEQQREGYRFGGWGPVERSKPAICGGA